MHFKKIHLLGGHLLAKIKSELANAEVKFFYTSRLQVYTGYRSVVDPKWKSLNERKKIGRKHSQWI
jgi:hypothetical protein